jgi:hypothetical protein
MDVGLNGHQWAQHIHWTLGIQEIGQYLQLWQLIQGTTLTDEADCLQWRWTPRGTYSAVCTISMHGHIPRFDL